MIEATEQRLEGRTRRETVRASLCKALLDLVEHTPFKDVSVDDIAVAAGIKRSAFYFYFSDKQELLVATATDTAEALMREADRWWHGHGPSEERLVEALRGMAELYERHAALLRVATEVSTYDEEVRRFWRQLVERFIEATATHLRREQEAGAVPRSLEPRAIAESLVWMAERSCYVYIARGERPGQDLVESLSAVWTAVLYPSTAGSPTRGREHRRAPGAPVSA